jgi:hypothetical protein
MKFLLDKSNQVSKNSFIIDISEYSLNSLKINHLFINDLKSFKSFQFYIQEDNNRTDGILISIPFDLDPVVILGYLQLELNKKCENEYTIESVDGYITITSNEIFNLVFTSLEDYKEIFPVLGFTKSLYKHKKSYTSEISLVEYLNFDPNYVYITMIYNNSNLICKKKIKIQEKKQLTYFNKFEFDIFTLGKFINNVKIQWDFDKYGKIPYTHNPDFLLELNILNYNKNQT